MRDREKAKEWQKEYRRLNKNKYAAYERTLNRRYGKLHTAAKSRNVDISLTFKQYEALRLLPCDYCLGELPEAGCGLDRVDSSKGYHIDNVVPCCDKCNQSKMEMSIEEFKSHIEAIYNHFIKKA